MKIALAFIARRVAKRLRKSATAAVAAGTVTVGGALTIHPELIDLIPDEYRSVALLVLGIVIAAARVRSDVAEAWKEIRNGR